MKLYWAVFNLAVMVFVCESDQCMIDHRHSHALPVIPLFADFTARAHRNYFHQTLRIVLFNIIFMLEVHVPFPLPWRWLGNSLLLWPETPSVGISASTTVAGACQEVLKVVSPWYVANSTYSIICASLHHRRDEHDEPVRYAWLRTVIASQKILRSILNTTCVNVGWS